MLLNIIIVALVIVVLVRWERKPRAFKHEI